MTKAKSALVGRWRIVEADLWDRDFLDLCGPATLVVAAKDTARSASAPCRSVSTSPTTMMRSTSPGAASTRWTRSRAPDPPNFRKTAPSSSTSSTISATKPSSKPCDTLLQQPAKARTTRRSIFRRREVLVDREGYFHRCPALPKAQKIVGDPFRFVDPQCITLGVLLKEYNESGTGAAWSCLVKTSGSAGFPRRISTSNGTSVPRPARARLEGSRGPFRQGDLEDRDRLRQIPPRRQPFDPKPR